MALMGLFFNSTNVFTCSNVSLKIKRERSSVPNRLETAGNLLPFTFSKRIAGPWCSNTRKWMAGKLRPKVLAEFVGRDETRSEISDPYGSDLASYRQTYDELEELIGGVVSRVAGPVR